MTADVFIQPQIHGCPEPSSEKVGVLHKAQQKNKTGCALPGICALDHCEDSSPLTPPPRTFFAWFCFWTLLTQEPPTLLRGTLSAAFVLCSELRRPAPQAFVACGVHPCLEQQDWQQTCPRKGQGQGGRPPPQPNPQPRPLMPYLGLLGSEVVQLLCQGLPG